MQGGLRRLTSDAMWSGTISLLGGHMHAVYDASRSADPSVSEPYANPNAALPVQVWLFGGLTVLKRGKPVTCRGVARERLLAQVWPETEASLAVQSLHSLVHSLHRMLGDAIDGAMPVVHAGEIYRLNLEAGITVDINAFEALARQGNQAWQAGQWPVASDCYRQA